MGALIVNYRSLLELVGGEVGESGELGWRSAVCASFEAKGLGKIFRACMLSLGNVVYYRSLLELVGRGGRGVGGVRYRAGGVCVDPLGQRGW